MGRASLLAAIVVLGQGCATVGAGQTASTVGRGRVQVSLEPAIFWAEPTGIPPLPRADVGVRYGVSDVFDVTGRVGSTGLELGGKYLFTGPDSPVIVSIAPSVGGFYVGVPGLLGGGAVTLQVPVLVGIPVGEGHELVIGPKLHDMYVFGGAGDTARAGANALSVGSSFGFAWRVGERFRVLPELAFIVPVYGNLDASALGQEAGVQGSTAGKAVVMQATVGFLFGGR